MLAEEKILKKYSKKDIMRPTYLEVDLDRLRYNIRNIKERVGQDCKTMLVLKADGYGTGAVEIAKIGEEEKVFGFGVATLIEALELRKNNITSPILVLGFIEENHIDRLVGEEISQTIYSYKHALAINEEAKRQGKIAKIHIKIDTGMSRLGLQINRESLDIIKAIVSLENIEVEGIFSHLLDAENRDKSLCHLQYERFINFLEELKEAGLDFKIKHILNSGGIIDLIDYKLDMVRAGIVTYGLYPHNVEEENLDLDFIACLRTKIADIKYINKGDYVGYSRGYRAEDRMKVATIPIGYADGYSEEIRQAIRPKISGIEVGIIGNICMDQTILDVSKIENLKIGDEVELFTYEDRDSLAIRWISGLARRVPRVYLQSGELIEIRNYLLD